MLLNSRTFIVHMNYILSKPIMIFHLIHKDMHTLVTLRMTFHWAITENWNILSMEPTNQPWWMPNTYKRESYQIPSPAWQKWFCCCLVSKSYVPLCNPRNCRPPGKSTGVGCHFLFQGIFPTQASPALAGGSSPLGHQGGPTRHIYTYH